MSDNKKDDSDDKIELNDDGTATCERCGKDKPPEGFTAGWENQGYWDPPIWVQVCGDCSAAERKHDEEMEKFYSGE